MIRHPKRRGEWVEMQFMARAAAHGLTVSKPWGDSARYDFIVESKGHCLRVQVKSTISTQGSSYKCTTRTTVPYTAAQVDFIACYIIPEDIWYIVPTAEMIRAKCGVFLNPHFPRNRYFRYLEAWHLLTRTPKHAQKDNTDDYWHEYVRDAIEGSAKPPAESETAQD